MPLPPDSDPRTLLRRWAAGDDAAGEALKALCRPTLIASFGDDRSDHIAAALQRVLAAVPRFVVTDVARLHALMGRLVEHELADGDAPVRDSARADVASVVLDLDRGRSQAEPEPAERNAWVKLALMLLAKDERALLVHHWVGASDAALAKHLRATTSDVTERRTQVVRRHDEIVRELERGGLAAALSAAAGPATADAWGIPTQWSMVLGAVADDDDAVVQQSWRRLLDRYRDPIRMAICRAVRGTAANDELVEGFFTYLFEHRVLAKADPAKGRFRAYIQAVLKRYLLKRGRGQRPMAQLAEEAGPAVAPADLAAERADESAWAAHVLRLAIASLMERSARDGEVLLRYYGIAWPQPGARPAQTRDDIAAALGITAHAVDQANYRARRLLRTFLERELRATVQSHEDYAHESNVMLCRLLEAYPGLV